MFYPSMGGVNNVSSLASVVVFQTPLNFNFLFCFVAKGMQEARFYCVNVT